MAKLNFENCIMFKSNEFEEIKKFINKYDDTDREVVIKFLDKGDIIVVISNINFNIIQNDKLLKKQSRLTLSNVEYTKYRLEKFTELDAVKIKYIQSKNFMIIKNKLSGEYYILNKLYYDSDKILEQTEKMLEDILNMIKENSTSEKLS